MFNHGPGDILRKVEEGSHATGVRLSANVEEKGHRPTQDPESALAVKSGSQASSPAPSVTRMNKSESKGSVVNEPRQIGLPSRESHVRPPSCATEDEVAIAEPDARPSPDTIKRVTTDLQQQGDIKPSPLKKLRNTLCIPYSTRKTQKKEDDFGNVELDTERPGTWVVDHHLRGLVLEIMPTPAEGSEQRIISRLRAVTGKSHQARRLDEDKSLERTFRVSFAEMQRMHLRKLQIGLVKHAVTMYSTRIETENWEKDLSAYTQAMKEYDYMMEYSKRPRDHFLVTGERSIDHYVTRRVVKDVLHRYNQIELDKMSEAHPLGPWEYDGQPIGGTRNSTLKAMSFKGFRDRLFLATVGAALLLGPMWLVVLHNTLYTGLITTTVCVSVFGLVVVFRLQKPMDVLSATAAYAAVLVVFVGLTTDSS